MSVMAPSARRSAIIASLALVLLVGSGTAGAAAQPSCADGLRQLQGSAPNPGAAARIYRQIQPQDAPCVQSGLTAATALLQAKAFAAQGFRFRSKVDDAIVRAIEAEPTLTVPGDLNLGTSGVAVAETLDRDGFHDEARQTLLRVIEEYPSTPLTSKDKAILGQTGHPWYWWVWAVVTASRTWEILTLLLLAGLGVAWWRRRRLYFQPFTGGETTAADLRSLIRLELHRLAEESARSDGGRRLRIDQAGPYEDELDLGTVADGLPGGDIVKALITMLKLVGTRSRLVTGHLLPDPKVHLALETVRSKKVTRLTEIEAGDLDFPATGTADHSMLALPSAVWIILTHYPEETLGGTKDWQSFVDFAAGCAWQEKWEKEREPGDLRRARKCYARACQDPANTAAAVNLARLDQWRERSQGARRQNASSHELLNRVVKATRNTPNSLQWYRARYLLSNDMRDIVEAGRTAQGATGLAGGSAVQGTAPGDPAPDDASFARTARDYAVELAIKLEDESKAKELPSEFLIKARPAALTLLARQAFPQSADPANWITANASNEALTPKTMRKELHNLRRYGPRPGTAERLVEFVRDNCKLDDQAHYNLLRYYDTRVRIIAASIDGWQSKLDERKTGDPAWREKVMVWMDKLEVLCQGQLQQMREHEEQVRDTGDPLLIQRVQDFSTPTRPAREAGNGHHPDYGTPRQRPEPTSPPPPEPPSPPELPDRRERRPELPA